MKARYIATAIVVVTASLFLATPRLHPEDFGQNIFKVSAKKLKKNFFTSASLSKSSRNMNPPQKKCSLNSAEAKDNVLSVSVHFNIQLQAAVETK